MELGWDKVPLMTVINFLIRIYINPITYENAISLRKHMLLSEIWLKYVKDIIFPRDEEKLGVFRKEVVQFISDIVQANSYF